MNKLVRDKFGKTAKKKGSDSKITTLQEKELLPALLEKLEREHEELRLSFKVDQLVEITEVLYAIARQLGLSEEELLDLVQEKRDKEGGYSEGLVMVTEDDVDQGHLSGKASGFGGEAIQDTKKIKTSIIEALTHPEAEDGLYFRNFYHLHEEDERGIVPGNEEEILEALKELLDEGKIVADETGKEIVFFANRET